MNDETKPKEKTFDFPMMPFYGVEVGERLGSMDARLTRVERDIWELKRDVKAVDDRVDKCLVAINRLDERLTGGLNSTNERINSLDARLTERIDSTNERISSLDARLTGRISTLSTMMIGLWVTVIGGIVMQFFFK